jgi:RND family efflux transporter MFP subunit
VNKIILLLLAFLLASCGNEELPEENKITDVKSHQATRSVKITTAISELRDVDVIEEALGRVLDPATTTISSEVPARVREVLFDIGDQVRKGDTLAKLDRSDMQVAVSTAEANLARYIAQAKAQDRLVHRYRRLAEDKFVSTTMLDQAETQLVAFQKSVKAAKAQLRQAKNNLARTGIIAPVAGTIQKRFIAAGDYIGVGKPMFQLVTDNQFVISITIPETRIHSVKAGLPVRMHLPDRDQIISAFIDDLTPMIGAATNAFEARVKIRNPGNWRPGGTVISELIIATHKQAVVVPEECVVLRPAGEVVYVVKGEKVESRSIRTGVHRDGYIEITDGLESGVTLAATGASFLSDGASIQVQGVVQ